MARCQNVRRSSILLCGVEARGYEGRLLLGYNPHLRPGSGRIGVWSEELGSGTRISMADVIAASDSARVWLAGYFAGCEPEPHDMFGPGIHDAPSEDPRWQRDMDASKRFRETGEWPAVLWVELTPFAAGADLPVHVHTVRGDEMWVWPAAPGYSPTHSRTTRLSSLRGRSALTADIAL